jgi:nicotinamide mononucleotide transporter
MEFMSFWTLDRALELAGLGTGLACVWLLIRQHIATWPLGIVYVFLSLYLFWQARLYADFLLHLGFLALNGYGWWAWARGRSDSGEALPVTRSSRGELLGVVLLGLVGTVMFGTLFARYTDASLPYWDNATTAFSLGAMWLSARKRLENWVLWFAVDVVATGIYALKGLPFYAVLYAIYLGLAVQGYRQWRQSLGVVP